MVAAGLVVSCGSSPVDPGACGVAFRVPGRDAPLPRLARQRPTNSTTDHVLEVTVLRHQRTQGCDLVTQRAARSVRPERRPGGCHCGRRDRIAPAVGLGAVPVGGASRHVLASGRSGWRAGAARRADRLRLLTRHRRKQARDGDMLRSRWNHAGWCVSGVLATAEHGVAAAGQTGEGHRVGGRLGDG